MIRRDGRPFYARDKKTLAPYVAYYNSTEACFEFVPFGNTRNVKRGFTGRYMEFPDYMEPTGTLQ